jgi:hypothetical protein
LKVLAAIDVLLVVVTIALLTWQAQTTPNGYHTEPGWTGAYVQATSADAFFLRSGDLPDYRQPKILGVLNGTVLEFRVPSGEYRIFDNVNGCSNDGPNFPVVEGRHTQVDTRPMFFTLVGCLNY